MESVMERKNNKKEYDVNFAFFYDRFLTDFANEMANIYLNFISEEDIKEKKILDLMCGTGTLLNLFNNNGWNCTGVDISENMLRIAKEKNRNINFVIEDVTKLQLIDTFNVITCTADAINHLPSINDVKKCFSSCYKLLDENGFLFFDMNTKLGIINNEFYISSHDEDGICIRNGMVDLVHNVGFTKFSGITKNGDSFLEFKSTIYNYIYSMTDIKNILMSLGFSEINYFDPEKGGEPVDGDPEKLDRIGFIVRK